MGPLKSYPCSNSRGPIPVHIEVQWVDSVTWKKKKNHWKFGGGKWWWGLRELAEGKGMDFITIQLTHVWHSPYIQTDTQRLHPSPQRLHISEHAQKVHTLQRSCECSDLQSMGPLSLCPFSSSDPVPGSGAPFSPNTLPLLLLLSVWLCPILCHTLTSAYNFGNPS